MELEEAKMEIMKYIAQRVDGVVKEIQLSDIFRLRLGSELFNSALKSLQEEKMIKEETTVYTMGKYSSGYYWVLTGLGKKTYNLGVREWEYTPQHTPDDSPGLLRVVGSGGQTLDHISAPDKRECLYMCCGFIIVALAIILYALSIS